MTKILDLRTESPYFNANHKNRRVLGIKSRSISFRTHEKVASKHDYIRMTIRYEDKDIVVKVPILTLLARLTILGLARRYVNSGHSVCTQIDHKALGIDQQTLQAMKLKLSKREYQKFLQEAHNSDRLRHYYQSLPLSISFNLREYEKQVLYLRCFIEHKTVVEELRYLYHADITGLSDQFQSYAIHDFDLFVDLLHGLDHGRLSEIISFSDYELPIS